MFSLVFGGGGVSLKSPEANEWQTTPLYLAWLLSTRAHGESNTITADFENYSFIVLLFKERLTSSSLGCVSYSRKGDD